MSSVAFGDSWLRESGLDRSWFQVRVRNRSALTRTSFASGWRGKTGITTNLRAENIAASLLMDAVPEPSPTLWGDEAGPSSPPVLDSVGFGPVSVSLTGETLGEQSWVLLLISHTHLDGKCVLAA